MRCKRQSNQKHLHNQHVNTEQWAVGRGLWALLISPCQSNHSNINSNLMHQMQICKGRTQTETRRKSSAQVKGAIQVRIMHHFSLDMKKIKTQMKLHALLLI